LVFRRVLFRSTQSHTRRVLRRWLLLRLLAGGLAATALVVVVLDLHLDLVVLAPATSDRSTTGGAGEVLPGAAVDAVAPTGDLGAVIAPGIGPGEGDLLVLGRGGDVDRGRSRWSVRDRKSTRLNSSHVSSAFAVF